MKSIINSIEKFIKKNKRDIILVIIIVLISMFSFAVGYITANYKIETETNIKVINSNE